LDKTKFIIGLGNPGSEYEWTRHNLGFLVVDQLAQKWGATFKNSSFAKVVMAEAASGETSVKLVKPMTYMNNSGVALRALVEHFKFDLAQILVITDDINLDFGRLRLRPRGSDGGHNGLSSSIYHLASEDFPRLRMGVHHPGDKENIPDYVLGEFFASEKSHLDEFIDAACGCCQMWLTEGIERTMEKYNQR